MFKYKFIVIIFCLIVSTLLLRNVQADPLTLQEEFNYFLRYGHPSSNFYSNITEDREESAKETILHLQQQEQGSSWRSEKDKQKAAQSWRSLSEQHESDIPSRILYLRKSLEMQWDGDVAIALANWCHHLVPKQSDTKTQIRLAYRGFATLGVNLKEPTYDYHKKLRTAPQVINLLEDLKASTLSMKSVADLDLPLSDAIFHKDCIPQAEVCSLLTVAYGADILAGLPDTSEAQRNIYNNGKTAISLYQKGLQDQTTPEQREYYHKQIVNLVLGLTRTPGLLSSKDDSDVKLMQKSSHALARIFKDAHEESENPLTRAELAFKTAVAYFHAGKKESALKYITIVSAIPQEDSQRGRYINGIKIRAENLRLQIEDPSAVLAHQVDNGDVFLGLGW